MNNKPKDKANSKKLSLQDQLLQAGLTSDARARQLRSEKHKQTLQQQRQGKEALLNETQAILQAAKLEQQKKDHELNQQQKQLAEQKAIAAQIQELIAQNELKIVDEGLAFHFTDQNKVKTLYVSEKIRQAISKGSVGIVKAEKGYALVPAETALKIGQRNSEKLLMLNETQVVAEPVDEYANFIVPDDLMW